MTLEESVIRLIHDEKGNRGRLEHILDTIQKGNMLYASDKEYLNKLLDVQQKEESVKSEPNKIESSNEGISEKSPVQKSNQNDVGPSDQNEIEQLHKEIHRLQDRNYVIEEHLKNQDNTKSGSMLRAFGRGIGGVSLFLFGLGMIFLLYHTFNNLDSISRGMYYGGNPLVIMVIVFIVIPAILFSIGGASIYYGIRIISKT